MFTSIIIGNLGGDAEFHNDNGNQYVTFRVADTQRRTDENGQTHETTNWISCILNGDGGRLLQYLTKGQKVCVIGETTLNTFHSKVQRALIAGARIFVRQIELVGAKPDAVPGYLFREDGTQVNVGKYYFAADVAAQDSCTLFDRSGQQYQLQKGWVVGQQSTTQETTAETTTETTENATDAPFAEEYGQQQEEPSNETKKE